MKLKLAIIIICSLLLGGCSLSPKKSGLEVISYPPAKVFINNKEVGTTPYKNINLKPGSVEVRLESNNQKWSKKIDLQNNINTVIDWEFGIDSKSSGGYVLFLEKTGDSKKAGLLVNATPDKASIKIDNEIKGYSPQRISDIGEGDRQLTLSFPGRKNLDVFMKAINGYQLVIEGVLAEEEIAEEETEIVPTPSIGSKSQVVILETETGFLRVRDEASNNGKEIDRVKPKEKYELVKEENEWFLINMGEGETGWISTKYAEKTE
jgi:hypothetical protein